MDQPFIGAICSFGFNFAPRQWSTCAGQLLAVSSNTSLFSLLGTEYGGDGRTTFALPDLRGRASISMGRHPGSNFDWRMGQAAGSETHTLTSAELASHSHTSAFTSTVVADVNVSTDAATQDGPTEGAYLAKNDGGRDPGIPIYRADAGSGTVKLGGVTSSVSGAVDIHNAGGSMAFSIMQPTMVVNDCIAMFGIYPSRS